ncbi:hypothetical protein D3C85_353590 [compost metagenome]|jgi:hypothetical protein
MLLKNHTAIGQMYFEGPEQFEAFLDIHREINAEDFTDASEAEIEEYQTRVVTSNTRGEPSVSKRLRTAKSTAIRQAQHFDIMGEPEQAAAWRSYYRELYALGTHPDWPLVAQWPAAPSH